MADKRRFLMAANTAPRVLAEKDGSVQFFERLLAPAANINFAADAFRNASGSGRTAIKRAIEERIPAG
jgi:hypothetical protein